MIKNIIDELPLVFTIDNFYTKDQCKELIKLSEDIQYTLAPITVGKNEYEFQLDNRDNTRVILDDPAFADQLFNQLKEYLPTSIKGWELSKLNSRIRYYKYQDQQKFTIHIDGRHKESIDSESRLTLLIYLSEGFTNGETSFFDDDYNLRFKVEPKIGQVLVFDHHQLHAGEPVSDGIKYVLRTDVMYSRKKYE